MIKSISGIRGTIGGKPGDNLTPEDIVQCTAGFGTWVLRQHGPGTIVIGRDGRMSGEMVSALVSQTLMALGFDVIDLGWSTTPSVEMAVTAYEAQGGIILTASHNPKEWNALKLLNPAGEFISAAEGEAFLALIGTDAIQYAEVENLGKYRKEEGFIREHVDAILALPAVKTDAIQRSGFKVVVDPVNSTGALAIPHLLDRLGVEYTMINGDITGVFAHNAEPLPHHLDDLREKCTHPGVDLGIAVDPDVDRLAFVAEDGSWFGEEYTLVMIADYILGQNPGPTVSNLSSSRALRDLAASHDQKHYTAAVGEVNVVEKMKAVGAAIGGEGNGGIIYPPLHYGRDALVGIALALSFLAQLGQPLSAVRKRYSHYEMHKGKVQLSPGMDIDRILDEVAKAHTGDAVDRTDGVKVDFEDSWVHLRKSNTEPIIRIYAEAPSQEAAKGLADRIGALIQSHN